MILKYTAKHFEESEFDCKCADSKCPMKGTAHPMSALVVIALDIIRASLKMSVRVNSGRRCEAHNKAIGGAEHSRHTKSEAADISCADYPALRAAAVPVCEFLGLRIVRYDKESFLHIQVK